MHRVWYGYVPARSSFITIIITISDAAAAGRIQLKLMLWSSKVYKDCILPSSSSSLGKVSYKKENLDELYKFKIWMFILMLLTHIPIYSWDDQLFIVFFQSHLNQIFTPHSSNWYSGGQSKVKVKLREFYGQCPQAQLGPLLQNSWKLFINVKMIILVAVWRKKMIPKLQTLFDFWKNALKYLPQSVWTYVKGCKK